MGTNERRRRTIHRQAAALIVASILIALGAYALYRIYGGPSYVEARCTGPSAAQSPRLFLEVAATPASQQKGLMFRKSLEADHGMIFVYPDERVSSFWMKNTYIPLDMIFVDRHDKVVGVLENRQPFLEESMSAGKPSLYVVELNAGSAKRWGITTGSTLVFESPHPAFQSR